MHQAQHLSTTYLKVLGTDDEMMRVLRRIMGERVHEVLKRDYIYEDEIESIFHAFADAGLSSWLLRFGEQISVATHGPLGFAVMSAPDLHSALNVLADYTIIRTSTYHCKINYYENRVEYQATSQLRSKLVERWLLETGLSVVQKLIETIMAHRLGDNAVIHFTGPAPDYRQALEEFYGVRCEFNSNRNSISIPASWCRIPSPLSEPETFQTNLQKCRELKLVLEGSPNIVASVRLAIDSYFENRAAGRSMTEKLPTLSSLAQMHNTSSRTLARKLESEQQSYKKILEVARKEQALLLLKTTHLTIADIADRLAYQEPASFIRAFNSWFNTSPTQWRRHAHD